MNNWRSACIRITVKLNSTVKKCIKPIRSNETHFGLQHKINKQLQKEQKQKTVHIKNKLKSSRITRHVHKEQTIKKLNKSKENHMELIN